MLRFLLDENLPVALAKALAISCHHVTDLGEQLTDQEIWERARQANEVILTKDADFFEHLILMGPPPKVVWVRTGNLRKAELESLLIAQFPRILELLERVDLIEVHSGYLETFTYSNE